MDLNSSPSIKSTSANSEAARPQFFVQASQVPSSLLPSQQFQSRFEKELELGLLIKEQVESGIPKGSLRAISSVWLSKYFAYIEKLILSDSDSARTVSFRSPNSLQRLFGPTTLTKRPDLTVHCSEPAPTHPHPQLRLAVSSGLKAISNN